MRPQVRSLRNTGYPTTAAECRRTTESAKWSLLQMPTTTQMLKLPTTQVWRTPARRKEESTMTMVTTTLAATRSPAATTTFPTTRSPAATTRLPATRSSAATTTFPTTRSQRRPPRSPRPHPQRRPPASHLRGTRGAPLDRRFALWTGAECKPLTRPQRNRLTDRLATARPRSSKRRCRCRCLASPPTTSKTSPPWIQKRWIVTGTGSHLLEEERVRRLAIRFHFTCPLKMKLLSCVPRPADTQQGD